eukprot:g8248.t1 g8248   contig29:82407-83444(-)
MAVGSHMLFLTTFTVHDDEQEIVKPAMCASLSEEEEDESLPLTKAIGLDRDDGFNWGRPLSICLVIVAVASISRGVFSPSLQPQRSTAITSFANDTDAIQVSNNDDEDASVAAVVKHKSTSPRHKKYKSRLPKVEETLMHSLSDSSLARSRVVDMLIHQYLADDTPDEDDMNDKLQSALEAMELCSSDSQPIPVNHFPYLFVGSVGGAMNEEGLREAGITHVINWSSSAKCNLFSGIKYLCVTGVRHKEDLTVQHLDEAVEFVEQARIEGGKVLSHCWYGKNRSVSLLVVYLMKYEGMTAEEASDLIKQTRPQAAPYWKQVYAYGDFLRSSTSAAAEDDDGVTQE